MLTVKQVFYSLVFAILTVATVKYALWAFGFLP